MPVFRFKLQVITPVHIGMDRSKDYIRGFDFIYHNGEYIVYSFNRLISQLSQSQQLQPSVLNADLKGLINYIKSQRLVQHGIELYRWRTSYGKEKKTIRRHIQDGMGNWIIPGSSLKGSIRGILATYLYRLHNFSGDINENQLFGEIDFNLMRFIHVTDCVMKTSQNGTAPVGIYPIKIFSGDIGPNNQYVGRWKNKDRHVDEFNPYDDFVTYYEMLKDDRLGLEEPAEGEFFVHWGWDSGQLANFFNNKIKNHVKNVDYILKNTDPVWIIKTIQEHTNRFLEKEISYFENFQNQDLTDESFFDEIEWLRQENNRDQNSCLLRVGANVGWHSITADWKNYDFVKERISRNQKKNFKYQLKTRKIVFDLIPSQNNDVIKRFMLPGFVKLTLIKDPVSTNCSDSSLSKT